MISLSNIISHVRDREYMSGIVRDYDRLRVTAEVFTPTKDVQRYLDLLPQELFTDSNENFLDYACGDGQFLSEALIRKLESLGKSEIEDTEFEQALSSIYGVDLMIDNIYLCRERLLCGQENLRHIVEKNIVCYNGLEYDYEFARRKKIEIKHELNERKKVERARKKTEKETEAARKKAEVKKMQLEKLKTEARKFIWNLLVVKTGKAPTEIMIERELKKRFPDLKG